MKVGERKLREGDETRQEEDGRKWLWAGRNCSSRACLYGLEEGADSSCNARVASEQAIRRVLCKRKAAEPSRNRKMGRCGLTPEQAARSDWGRAIRELGQTLRQEMRWMTASKSSRIADHQINMQMNNGNHDLCDNVTYLFWGITEWAYDQICPDGISLLQCQISPRGDLEDSSFRNHVSRDCRDIFWRFKVLVHQIQDKTSGQSRRQSL